MDFWSLEVTFGEMLVSLGRLWTRLVPGGGPGRRCWRNSPLQWTPFSYFLGLFWSKTVMLLKCFLDVFFDVSFMVF